MTRNLILVLAAVLLTATSAPPNNELDYLNALLERQGLPPQTLGEFEAARALSAKREADYEVQRLRGAGFVPASQIARQGRSQIRMSFSEPRLFIRMPGVTIERGKDSRSTLILSSDGRARTGQTTISKARWKGLAKIERAAFTADPAIAPMTWRKGDPLPETHSGCHGWGVTLERITPVKSESVWGWECNGTAQSRARLAYGMEVAKISLSAFPECRNIESPAHDPLPALAKCFGKFEPSTSDNP